MPMLLRMNRHVCEAALAVTDSPPRVNETKGETRAGDISSKLGAVPIEHTAHSGGRIALHTWNDDAVRMACTLRVSHEHHPIYSSNSGSIRRCAAGRRRVLTSSRIRTVRTDGVRLFHRSWLAGFSLCSTKERPRCFSALSSFISQLPAVAH